MDHCNVGQIAPVHPVAAFEWVGEDEPLNARGQMRTVSRESFEGSPADARRQKTDDYGYGTAGLVSLRARRFPRITTARVRSPGGAVWRARSTIRAICDLRFWQDYDSQFRPSVSGEGARGPVDTPYPAITAIFEPDF